MPVGMLSLVFLPVGLSQLGSLSKSLLALHVPQSPPLILKPSSWEGELWCPGGGHWQLTEPGASVSWDPTLTPSLHLQAG